MIWEVHDICTSGISRGDTGQVRIVGSSGQGQGHRSLKGRKSLFPQCKTLIGNNSGSITHRALKLARRIGFGLWQIEWCDRHFCYETRVLRLKAILSVRPSHSWTTLKRFKIPKHKTVKGKFCLSFCFVAKATLIIVSQRPPPQSNRH